MSKQSQADKPSGTWQCAACGETWRGDQLYRHEHYIFVWTCGNLFCGGTCVNVRDVEAS